MAVQKENRTESYACRDSQLSMQNCILRYAMIIIPCNTITTLAVAVPSVLAPSFAPVDDLGAERQKGSPGMIEKSDWASKQRKCCTQPILFLFTTGNANPMRN
jgi:hypothetical protein